MDKSKNTRYCERCRENIDNSNFKKYGIFCTLCKEQQSHEIKANKHSYILANKSYKSYKLQKNDIVENAPIIEEIQPTRPNIRK